MKKEKKTLKEKWATPDGKIIIKFKLWAIFFGIIYLFAFISTAFNKNTPDDNEKNNTTTTAVINYIKMKNNLINNDLKVKYYINDYYISGNINDHILNGTLEINDQIYRIKYDSLNLYQIKKDSEIQNPDLINNININYLLPNYIIDILNKTDNTAIKDEANKTYTYDYENIKYIVHYNNTEIDNIKIYDNDISYDLKYEISQ